MPQKKSYFALQLPKGWWIFGLDLALHGDIDVYQFKFFSELVNKRVRVATATTSSLLMHLPLKALLSYRSHVSVQLF